MPTDRAFRWRDARLFQLLFLAILLGVGVLWRDFSIRPEQIVLCFVAGLLTQYVFLCALKLPTMSYLSPVITCLSLSLLLRADNLWAHPLAAVLAMASKFTLRWHGKHLYNPANFGLVLALLILPGTWISSGQWGNEIIWTGWFIGLGMIVTNRARRVDISWMFLVCYLGLMAARVAWLGQSWAIFWHQCQNGALLLFSFFMISDPMTTPNHRYGRWLFAALIATAAYLWQFVFYISNPLIWNLFLAMPLVPLLDRYWRASAYVWKTGS